MQVYIYDVDFLQNQEPNFLGMRISSYHKQLGDTVTLLRPKDKLPKKFGQLYILQRDRSLPKPPLKLLTGKQTRVYGVEYFTNWAPSAVILSCRPDYLLYPRGRDKYERSDAVQLSDDKGHLLILRQNDENIETNKDTIVTDENLWALSNSDLCTALSSLKNRKNIYFLRPIPLSRVVGDSSISEVFLSLSLARTRLIQWENSYPFMEDKVGAVIKFFDKFKELHPHVCIGGMSFYPKPRSTEDTTNLRLALKLLLWEKERCYQIELTKLHMRLDSVYVHYYEILHNWSLQPHLSFFELIAQRPAQRMGISIEEYYCHPEWWSDEMFRAGIELYHTANAQGWTDVKDWALWQYKERYYSNTNINWQALLRRELWF